MATNSGGSYHCYPHYYHVCHDIVNTLRPRQNGRHFADDIFKCIFLNENAGILLKISLKFVPKVRINNIPALVQIMAWRRPGDKPLSEPMMINLLTHICVTRPQWVNVIAVMHVIAIFITSMIIMSVIISQSHKYYNVHQHNIPAYEVLQKKVSSPFQIFIIMCQNHNYSVSYSSLPWLPWICLVTSMIPAISIHSCVIIIIII